MKPLTREEIAPFRIGSFDIECYSHDGAFPDPEEDENVIFQIAVTTRIWGQKDNYDQTCLCLKDTKGGPNIKCYETEKDLLIGFCSLLHMN